MAETPKVSLPRLILVPALLTLAVTVLRLVGELQQWSPTLFNRNPGGGGALVGIVWLIPLFGMYFALKLAHAGEGPVSVGKALGWTLLGFAVSVALTFGAFKLLSAGPVAQLGIVAYGFAARLPVLLIMFLSIFGGWDTHYSKPRPDFPAMGPGGALLVAAGRRSGAGLGGAR